MVPDGQRQRKRRGGQHRVRQPDDWRGYRLASDLCRHDRPDNIINAAEHNQPLTLTGKTNAEAGQIVTVTLNGKNHTATVGSDGSWSVTLPASEVQTLANGEHTLTVNVSDKAGNGSSITADFTVDTAAPVVTINTVAGDDILNTSEQGQAQIISGRRTARRRATLSP